MSDVGCTYLTQRRCWAPPEAHRDGALGHDHTWGHEPREAHQYRVICEVCGERGQVVLSIEPKRVGTLGPDI